MGDLLKELVSGRVLDGAVVDGPTRVVDVEPSELSTGDRRRSVSGRVDR